MYKLLFLFPYALHDPCPVFNIQTRLFWKPLLYFFSGDFYEATFQSLVILW